jgi:CubicO group peptidase (beta-lactamase class C family)
MPALVQRALGLSAVAAVLLCCTNCFASTPSYRYRTHSYEEQSTAAFDDDAARAAGEAALAGLLARHAESFEVSGTQGPVCPVEVCSEARADGGGGGCALPGLVVKGALLGEAVLLQGEVARKADELRALSVSVTAVQGGSSVFESFKGSSSSSSSRAVSGRTKYQLASITKVFTAVVLFQMRDRGLLPQGLDTLVSELVPELAGAGAPEAEEEEEEGSRLGGGGRGGNSNSARRWWRRGGARGERRGITLRALAMHASGIPRELPVCRGGEQVIGAGALLEEPRACSEAEALGAARDALLLFPPFAGSAYSNLGVALLGRALERAASGRSWEQWVAEEVLAPLGMSSSGTVTEEALAQGLALELAEGVDPASGAPQRVRAAGWGAPSGGLYASAEDMARFMSFLLGSAGKAGERVLARSSVLEMLSTAAVARDGGMSGVTAGTLEAMRFRGGRLAVGKMGCLPGVRTDMLLVPHLRLGVFAAAASTCDGRGDGDAIAHPLAWTLAARVEDLLRVAQAASPDRAPLLGEQFQGSFRCGGDAGTTAKITMHRVPLSRLVLTNGPFGDAKQQRGLPFVLEPVPGARDLFRMLLGDGALATHLPKDWSGCDGGHKYREWFGQRSQNLCPLSCTLKMLRGDGMYLRFIRDGLLRKVSGFELIGSDAQPCQRIDERIDEPFDEPRVNRDVRWSP